MESMHLDIAGMSCGSCVNAVKTALSKLPGVHVERVSVGSADVSYDPNDISPERIADAVHEGGYEVTTPGLATAGAARTSNGTGGCGCC